MNSKHMHRALTSGLVLSLPIGLLFLAGCGREDVQVYTVSKEASSDSQQMQMPPGHPEVGSGMGGMMGGAMGAAPKPGITFKAPANWTQQAPGAMRAASFTIRGNGGKEADLSVVPLGGMAGGVVANVNRWRGLVGLDALSEEQVAKSAEKVEIAGQPAELYDFSGTNPGSGDPMRILAAIQQESRGVWFYKMTGDPGLIGEQKPAFIDFLKSVSYQEPDATGLPASHPPIDGMAGAGMGVAASGAGSADGKPAWQVPSEWKETAGGDFLVAKFLIGDDGKTAVNVSASAGNGGGLVGNINRWRQQLGLGAQSEGDIAKESAPVETAGGKATMVEIAGSDSRTGEPSKIVGVMVQQPDRAWFYKLMGSPSAVDAQKDAFKQFVQSAKY